jgi:isoleucyl-tRNA synthetase
VLKLQAAQELNVTSSTSSSAKCDRCWHYPEYPDNVGQDTAHPTICGRCISNLFGAGEVRRFA